jgi:branched-chain amino acid transport system substrate-binding protein
LLAILRTAVAIAALLVGLATANAAGPLKIGFSMAMTGGVAQNGKQLLIALELWRHDVNEKGGLLGRPVEFVYYDDQSNPSNVPGIYTKLINIDKVDLLLGPYATNMVAAAMPVIMENNKLTVGLMAVSINRHFNYPKYFSMLSVGPNGVRAFSEGFFALAAEQKPKPKTKTVAILSADAEFARTSADGARENAAAGGFEIVYDRSYPPSTTDFAPTVRAVQAANPDLVFVAAYPPDTVGIVRAANEIGLKPKMFGGTMIGLLITPIKMQLGSMMDGLVIMESYVPSFDFPGAANLIKRYRAAAAGEKIDPLGYGFVPFGYAAGEVLAQAVEGTKSLDADKLAAYMHSHKFETVVGEIEYGADGEWTRSRTLYTQFQHVAPNDIEQFASGKAQPVLWPPQYKTGEMIFPYADARK